MPIVQPTKLPLGCVDFAHTHLPGTSSLAATSRMNRPATLQTRHGNAERG